MRTILSWRTAFLGIVLAAQILWGASHISPCSAADKTNVQHPNVVFILTDDQRWDTIGVSGKSVVKTPHIDRLAAEGVYFPKAFCTTSLCSPSRASILSGLYAHSHGVTNNFTEYPADLPSFPRQLQQADYATAYIGKWHMGEDNDEKRPGFDYFVTHKGQGKYFDTEFNVDGDRKVIPGYYTTVVTDLAEKWLDGRAQKTSPDKMNRKPFLLMLGHKAPHSFYTPEPKYEHAFDDVEVHYPKTAFELDDKPEWFQTRLDTWHGIYGPLFDFRKKFPDRSKAAEKDFAAMTRAYWSTILSVDDSVGRIYAKLKAIGELDDTLFIFTADNGLLNGEHGMVDKRTMHEPSIRVPLVVRYPRLTDIQFSLTKDIQVLTIDFAPTILDICGVDPLPKAHGKSWKQFLLPRPDPFAPDERVSTWRDGWYYEYNYEKQFPYTPNVRGIRTNKFKYIHYPPGDGSPDKHLAELYNLADDREETKNLIADPRYKTQLAELKDQLEKLIAAADAVPDRMPLDEGIKSGLPDLKIR